jgi:hypothetical protein
MELNSWALKRNKTQNLWKEKQTKIEKKIRIREIMFWNLKLQATTSMKERKQTWRKWTNKNNIKFFKL